MKFGFYIGILVLFFFVSKIVCSQVKNQSLLPENIKIQEIHHESEKKIIERKILINKKISGIFCYPKQSNNKLPVVLMLHGFASQKNEVGDFYKRLARKLSENGVASLRIDFSGWGDSSEPMIKSSLDTMLNDAKIAYQFLSNNSLINPKKIVICGFSLGAYIAFELAKIEKNHALVMLSPVGNPVMDFSSELNLWKNKDKPEKTLIDLGWRKVILGENFFESVIHSSPLKNFGKLTIPILSIAAIEDSSYQYLRIIKNITVNQNKIISLHDSDHIFGINSTKDKSNYVINSICDWLREGN